MKIVLFTLLFTGACSSSFSQHRLWNPSGNIRSLYNDYIETENDGDINRLKQIQKKAQTFLQARNDLSNQDLGLLYTIDGSAWLEAGEYTTSLPLLLKADSLCALAFTPTSAEVLQAKRILSWSYGYNNHPELERKLSYAILTAYSTEKQKHIVEIADLYHTIGFNFGNEGKRSEEQDLYREGLRLLETFRPRTDSEKWNKLYELGLIYNSLSISQYASTQYAAALRSAQTSLDYRRQAIPESPQLATNWMYIGRSLYQTKGDTDSALLYLDRAIDLLERKDNQGNNMKGSKPWMSYQRYKADILQKEGRYDAIITEARSIITYFQSSAAEANATELVPVYCLLSTAYLKKGNTKDALFVMQKLKSKTDKDSSLPKLLRTEMNTQYAVAASTANPGEPAANFFSDVIKESGLSLSQLEQESFYIPVTLASDYLSIYLQAAEAITRQALVTRNTSELLQGIHVFGSITASLQSLGSWHFQTGVEFSNVTDDLNVHEKLLDILYNAKGMMNEPLRMHYAFTTIESSKANLLQESLSEENFFSRVLSPAENTKRLELKAALYTARKKETNGNLTSPDEIDKARENYNLYIQFLKKTYAGNEKEMRSVISETDPLLLNHKGVIINYFEGNQYLYAFTYQNGHMSFARKEILPQLSESVRTLRRSPAGDYKPALQSSNMLYNWLVQGVALNDELIIIPHKELSLISFSMLATSGSAQPVQYLFQKCPVRYSYSASLLRPGKKIPEQEASQFFGGFSASQFDTTRTNKWITINNTGDEFRDNTASLPGTAREVKSISDMMGGDGYYHVNPGNFLKHAGNYRILHVATHAFADDQYRCYFLFENDSAKNSLISDDEITALPIHAKMAVLSACNTGTGKMNNNEGMMISLGRSFFIAGCQSVVMSLWSVEDESTSEIMTAFYRHLQNGELKDEALRNAQQDYIRLQTDPEKKQPYYWAGFVVVGDNAAIQNDTGLSATNWILIAAGILLFAVITLLYFRRRFSSSST